MEEMNPVISHNRSVRKEERNQLNSHKSGLLWFTGLSASGKSTIAHEVERRLFEVGVRAYVLDGDNIRRGLNRDLSFSKADRRENMRRIAEVSKLLVDAGLIVLAAFISPFKADRQMVREYFRDDNFLEIYVKCSLKECERRDPKGKYRKARAGIIKNYTGVSSPYEEPEDPDLLIDTEVSSLDESVEIVMAFLKDKGFFFNFSITNSIKKKQRN